jgi:adenine-specific DNA-methyltransferase
LVQDDFLNWDPDDRFDAIVANPPYLRHHDLHYDFDIFAEIGRRNQVRLSRLTNIYGLFILEICRRLTDKGRAAVIVPGEWLNANFGGPIKRFLLDRELLHTLIYFSHAETVFDDALTTASILFIEKNNPSENRTHLRTIFVTEDAGIGELASVAHGSPPGDESIIEQNLPIGLLRQTDKWNHLLEHGPTVYDAGLVPLRTFATTRRGIATGANKFFHVRPSDLREHGISARFALPCIGRAADVAGPIFAKEDFDALVKADRRTYLVSFGDDLSDADRAYIVKGEQKGLPDRFLLAGRNPWYKTEQRPPADIWAAVFGRKGLRFVWNKAAVLNLTTFHCIYVNEQFRNPEFIRALLDCLNSPLIQDLARGNRRVYGGGLLKFEPRDLLDIPVPDLRENCTPLASA